MTAAGPIEPQHLTAAPSDFEGNQGFGRYLILTGSDGRAKDIAKRFTELKVKNHPRQHNLYLGKLKSKHGHDMDVATFSTGMGAPSVEVILTELIHLGARFFLRVGTCGSLAPETVKVGHLINASASVRDEATTQKYCPPEFPAMADLELIQTIRSTFSASNNFNSKSSTQLHTGIVHSKDSLYAREFYQGPLAKEHESYVDTLKKNGTIGSEMETSALFVLSRYYSTFFAKTIHAGAILAVIGDGESFCEPNLARATINHSIELSLETLNEFDRNVVRKRN